MEGSPRTVRGVSTETPPLNFASDEGVRRGVCEGFRGRFPRIFSSRVCAGVSAGLHEATLCWVFASAGNR